MSCILVGVDVSVSAMSQWSSGLCTRLWCERTKVKKIGQMVVFVTSATVICSLGHRLCTITAVPRSTQPCIPPGYHRSCCISQRPKQWEE